MQKEDELPEGMLKEAPPDLAKRPDGLACDFLDYIKAGKYSKAYDFLGAEAQGEISREAFVNGLTKYMAAASTKNSYMVREVSSERVVGKTGVVKVTDRNSPKSKPWTWEFEENYAGWKIRSLDLPPLMRYKERFSY
ncbi:hypothetical protein IJT17_07205 [bacterium]|nr:hypothetical protein [bacterium]